MDCVKGRGEEVVVASERRLGLIVLSRIRDISYVGRAARLVMSKADV